MAGASFEMSTNFSSAPAHSGSQSFRNTSSSVAANAVSAYNPVGSTTIGSAVPSAASVGSGLSYKEKYGTTSPYTSYGVGGSVAAFSPVEFPFATIGNMYGVDSATAYKEALQNTAIQRQMEDFKRAGLNPVLAARYGGADSNIGDVAFQAPVGVTAVGSGSGGGYDYYSDGSSSGSTSAKNASLSSMNKALVAVASNRNASQTVASLASAGTFAATKSFQLGAAAYYGVQAAANAISNIFKK